MPESVRENICIRPAIGTWAAVYLADRLTGPESLALDGQELLHGCRSYIDDIPDSHAVVTDFRATRTGGTVVVSSSGYFPFGSPIQFKQQATHAANHVRVTLDIQWPAQARVRHQLGIGSVFLPGQWQRLLCVPPALQVAQGAIPVWTAIPPLGESTGALTLGHWHQPPLALVFEHADGTHLEIGTGSDIWRWEHAFGHDPESGSYRLILEQDGIRFLREPLTCESESTPEARKYRLTWYAAWGRESDPPASAPSDSVRELDFAPGGGLAPNCVSVNAPDTVSSSPPALLLDFGRRPAPANWQRCGSPVAFAQGVRTGCSCWEDNGVQKHARQAIRQLAAWPAPGRLVLRGLTPGICWDAGHVHKNKARGLPHWDMNGILEFSEWASHKLGPGWALRAEIPTPWSELPSLQGLFAPSGFPSAPAREEACPILR